MTGDKTCLRFVFLVVVVMLLASILGLVACTKPPASAPSPVPTLVPAPSPKPVTPPSPQPREEKEETTATPGGPVPAHHFWGYVKTNTGEPAPGVEVTAWIDGELRCSITTDASGKYGTDPLIEFPTYLVVNAYDGAVIEFRVNGEIADETRLGTLMEVDREYQWQWQDIEPEWQAVYQAAEVNGLDLIYTP